MYFKSGHFNPTYLILSQMADVKMHTSLQDSISARASSAIHLCSISDKSSVNSVWRQLVPVCELVRACVNDEKAIPHYLSRIDGRVSDMRRRLDEGDLNQVIAINVLNMFSEYVKFTKHSTQSARKDQSEVTEQYDRLKTDHFNLQTQIETIKIEKEREKIARNKIRGILNEFDDEEKQMEEMALVERPPLIVNIRPLTGKVSTRGKRQTRTAIRMVTTSETVPSSVSVVPSSTPTSFPLSLLPLVTPHVDAPAQSNDCNELSLEAILGAAYKTNDKDEKKKKNDDKRRRPLKTEDFEVEESTEAKRGCFETEKVSNDDEEELCFACPFGNCKRVFNKMGTLAEHTTSDHYWQGALYVQCSECFERFDNDRTFENHQLSCTMGRAVLGANMWDEEETEEERENRRALEKKLLACPYPGCDFSTKSKGRSIFKHIIKAHGNDERACYKCKCGLKRRAPHTILFHRYSECRGGDIEWFFENPAANKKTDGYEELTWIDNGYSI